MKEELFEKMLNIDTQRSETRMDSIKIYNRYEPTPYKDLGNLFSKYEVTEKDHFVDFGSGKGRFSFYVNYFHGCGCTSVEIVEDFHKKAIYNYDNYRKKHKKENGKLFYVNCSAQQYEISDFENKFYFFNPFSVNIFISIVNKIINSYEQRERPIDIILYFPSEEYIDFVERRTAFKHIMDVDGEKISKNPREKFSIYRLGANLEDMLEEDNGFKIEIKNFKKSIRV